jgi:hypothetical protein
MTKQKMIGTLGGRASALHRGFDLWTPADDALLRELREDEGLEWDAIAPIIGRTDRACASRYERLTSRTRYTAADPKASPAATIAASKREEARDRLDLTGRIFGDPPPGYSALDRMRAQP